jgi:hypothetical protein
VVWRAGYHGWNVIEKEHDGIKPRDCSPYRASWMYTSGPVGLRRLERDPHPWSLPEL